VSPSLVRAKAEELSYHLHILLRYELEIAMIAADLKVEDLPAAWNEKSRKLIGVAPVSDRDGVLQDGHWASAMFGYFPTYTIGSLYAAQFAEAFERDRGLADDAARGDFKPLLAWLRKHVHHLGDRLATEDLVKRATGEGIDAEAYFAHINAKFA